MHNRQGVKALKAFNSLRLLVQPYDMKGWRCVPNPLLPCLPPHILSLHCPLLFREGFKFDRLNALGLKEPLALPTLT
jgi:hypothetical protein